MTQAVRIRYPKDVTYTPEGAIAPVTHFKGSEYELPSAAIAARVHPEATITHRHVEGDVWEPYAEAAPRAAAAKAASKGKPKAAAKPVAGPPREPESPAAEAADAADAGEPRGGG